MKDLESEDDYDSEPEFIDQEVFGDVNTFDEDNDIAYDVENFVNYLESEEDIALVSVSKEDYLSDEGDEEIELDNISEESLESEDKEGIVFDSFDDESQNKLKMENESIKLDLWLKKCVRKDFISNFLSYQTFTIENDESPISAVVSNFELKGIIRYKYKFNEDDFKNKLMKFFLPIGVISLVDIAKKHNTNISLTKDGLIKNFLKIFTPYELINILNEEGLNIIPYLDIPVLEQIYLLSDNQIKDLYKKKCGKGEESKIGMMSCIINHYDQNFLLSKNNVLEVD